MSKVSETWHSPRLEREITLVRYGEMGHPVLFFPTAAGDAEEAERFLLVDALGELLGAGRIKLYSVDSVAGMAWLKENNSTKAASHIQNQFVEAVRHEVVPAIRNDCNDSEAEILATGPSIGAFNALACICRHPDVFTSAICMSGTYDLRKFFEGEPTKEYYDASPLHFVPKLPDGEQLGRLRERFILITHGEGKWEDPNESWRIADVLGKRGIPNRVDPWGEEYDHDWPTWRHMLPKYLEELLPAEVS